jgi:formylglycine-generating enzyme required for sulfatase activity
VSSFRLDTYEVTVARFRKFEAAFATWDGPKPGDGNNPNTEADDGWESAFTAELPIDRYALRYDLACHEDHTWTDDPGDNEARSINCVSWHVAFAFCIWDGGWLPTEAEWNYAAAGGDEQRLYPWSNSPEDDDITIYHASYNVIPSMDYCGGDRMIGCAATDFISPGSLPLGNGKFGHADMAGNVYEWVRDHYGPYPDSCDNCVVLMGGEHRVARGGCYINYDSLVQTDWRLDYPPSADAGLGVRCARPIQAPSAAQSSTP